MAAGVGVNFPGGADPAYAAQWAKYQQSLVDQAANKGTALGTGLTALQQASGLPLLSKSGSTSTTVPRIGSSSSTSTSISGVPTGGFNSGSTGVGGSGAGGYVAPITAPNTTAANSATFAAAKDQAGQTAQGSLTALRDALGSRGMLGGGVEAGATTDLVQKAAQGANDMTRQNAITDAGNAEQNALAGYSGNIAQRGQDITSSQNANTNALAYRAQDITQRGQDISLQQAQVAQQQQALQGLLSALGSTNLY